MTDPVSGGFFVGNLNPVWLYEFATQVRKKIKLPANFQALSALVFRVW